MDRQDPDLPPYLYETWARAMSVCIGLLEMILATIAIIVEHEAIQLGSFVRHFGFVAGWAGAPVR